MKQLYKPLSLNWSTGWVSTSLKQVQTDVTGGFTEGLRCLHCISLRLNVHNKPATGVWISSGQPALQCVNSTTRGRSTLLSPATSLCVWTWRKSSSLHCYIWPTVRTLWFICEMMPKQKRRRNRSRWREEEETRRQTATGWQLPVDVPWLWKAFFAEIHPHPLTHVSVDLHQGAHRPVTNLSSTTTRDISDSFS